MSTPASQRSLKSATKSDWLHLATAVLEALIFLGASINFFFILDSMTDNGHFCPESQWNSTQVITIRDCYTDQGRESQESTKSAIITVGLGMTDLPSVFYGFLLDRFRLLFIRIIISLCFFVAFTCLSFVNFENEAILLGLISL